MIGVNTIRPCRVWLTYTVYREGDAFAPNTWRYLFEGAGVGEIADWLVYEEDCTGWRDIIIGSDVPCGEGDDDGALDWLIQNGIAPGQDFCVEFTPHYSRPDYETGEVDLDIDVEVIARGFAPANIAERIEVAYALAERQGGPPFAGDVAAVFA